MRNIIVLTLLLVVVVISPAQTWDEIVKADIKTAKDSLSFYQQYREQLVANGASDVDIWEAEFNIDKWEDKIKEIRVAIKFYELTKGCCEELNKAEAKFDSLLNVTKNPNDKNPDF